MKCVINGQNAIVLARAIQSFARIGDEMLLESNIDGLTLRTTNLSTSAFAIFTFKPNFFYEFVVSDSNDVEANSCKLLLKTCLGAFRNMKQVDSCRITLNKETSKLIIQNICQHETVKTHYISVLEPGMLHANYSTDNVPNVLGASPKLFSQIVNYFKTGEEEITIDITSRKMVVKNYLDGVAVDNRFVRTRIEIDIDEFERYHITKDTSITFNLRELRALLSFVDNMGFSMSANFETTGKPIVFVLQSPDILEAHLLMATLNPEAIEECMADPLNTKENDTSRSIHISSASSSVSKLTTNTTDNTSAVNKRSRNSHRQSSEEDDDNLFQFKRPDARETRQKRRKTLETPETDETTNNESRIPNLSNHDLLPNHSAGPVNVIFEDDSDSISISLAGNEPLREEPQRIRDHRELARNVFGLCFNSPGSPNLGNILVEESDEE